SSHDSLSFSRGPVIHFAEREARERKAHASSGPIVTLSSVIEAFFGIRFTPVQNDGNFSKAADDYKRSLSKLVQNGAPKE
ncbi:hypothetical protein LAZ03_23515, partial [Escherichia coli]|nr:hypothetical protein [Escherichia coli]